MCALTHSEKTGANIVHQKRLNYILGFENVVHMNGDTKLTQQA